MIPKILAVHRIGEVNPNTIALFFLSKSVKCKAKNQSSKHKTTINIPKSATLIPSANFWYNKRYEKVLNFTLWFCPFRFTFLALYFR